VEVRLIEDGQTTSTTQELVYKPLNWQNLDERWRYNVFAGQESKLLSNGSNSKAAISPPVPRSTICCTRE
jgi:hypothetical protein